MNHDLGDHFPQLGQLALQRLEQSSPGSMNIPSHGEGLRVDGCWLCWFGIITLVVVECVKVRVVQPCDMIQRRIKTTSPTAGPNAEMAIICRLRQAHHVQQRRDVPATCH